jgi:Kef-type K+ transport system membrane component KefB
MFLAGLELELAEFKRRKNKSIVFGALTFSIPLLIGLPVCMYVLGYSFNTSFLTASMFATHTLIAYPIVNRLGIAKSESVAVAVGGTIITDTAVLFLLAIITASRETGLSGEFWAGLLVSMFVFVSILVFVIPRVSSWFFKRLEDEKYAHFIFVLSVIFFCAFIAELAGLEPIIGAFGAGLVLNRQIPHASSLMNRIDFVGNSLFIPFFLVSVGMLIDVSVLTKGPEAIIVAIVLTIVALMSKWLAAYFTGAVFKYSPTERRLIFGLSSAHAAATLAVILVGYRIGLIDDNILNGTIVLILFTCVVASLVTEKAGKQLALKIASEPAKISHNQRILVPISNPLTMERLVDFAIMIKQKFDHAPIVGLTVVKDDNLAQAKLMEARKLLEKAISHAVAAEQYVDIMATIDRNVSSGIMRIIKERFITDVVVGWSPDKKLADIIFGRTFDHLVRRSQQNIFITRFLLPLNLQRKLVIICPTFAEKEPGFYKWVSSILNLSMQLRTSVTLYGTTQLNEAFSRYIVSNQYSVEATYTDAIDLSKPTQLSNVNSADMIIIVSSREGGISYTKTLDILPNKIASTFGENNLVFIYPEIKDVSRSTGYVDKPTEVLWKDA